MILEVLATTRNKFGRGCCEVLSQLKCNLNIIQHSLLLELESSCLMKSPKLCEINFHIVQCIYCYPYRTSLRYHILFSVYEKREEKIEIFGR